MSDASNSTNMTKANQMTGPDNIRAAFVKYGILIAALLALPMIAPPFWIYFTAILGINVIAVYGLNVMMGYTGLLSLGHAAFMGVGAYAAALGQIHLNLPFWLSIPLAGIVTAVIGVGFGLPALRIRGLYLVIATLAAQFILMFVFVHWTSVTNGDVGLNIEPASLFGYTLATDTQMYYVILAVLIASTLFTANVIRSRVGRAFVAVRERDLTAAVLGVNIVYYKLLAFAFGSFLAGIAGGLLVYFNSFVTPEQFNLQVSIFFLAAVIIGGQGSMLGSVLGAIFMTVVPELLRLGLLTFSDVFGFDTSQILVPLRETIFGLLIVTFLIFEPRGMAHLWHRVRKRVAPREQNA